MHPIQADTEVSAALNGIALQMWNLRRAGLSQEQCRDLYARTLVELVNAAGIDMYGRTLFNPSANSQEAVDAIADQLGTNPTGYRTKLFVSPYERLAAGSSAVIMQQDSEGNDNVLLIRTRKHPDQWTIPAGYMDPLPASKYTVADRVTQEQRSIQEEAQVAGTRVNLQVPQLPHNTMRPVVELPSTQETRESFMNEYRRLLKDEGWQSALAHMNDPDYLRCIMARDGHPIPVQPASGSNYDLTPKDNIRREAKEETGLDIDALEREGKARVTLVSTDVGLAANGGKRPNMAVPRFLIDLGYNDKLPALKPEDKEVVEAAWVPLKDIRKDEKTGGYVVNHGCEPTKPLCEFVVPHLEESLNKLLSHRLQAATGNRIESVKNLRAQSESWQGRMATEGDTLASVALEIISTMPEGALPSLIDEKGQSLMHALPRAAAAISMAQDTPQKPQKSFNMRSAWVDRIADAIVQQATQIPRNP